MVGGKKRKTLLIMATTFCLQRPRAGHALRLDELFNLKKSEFGWIQTLQMTLHLYDILPLFESRYKYKAIFQKISNLFMDRIFIIHGLKEFEYR
jgi:hypothetical protein